MIMKVMNINSNYLIAIIFIIGMQFCYADTIDINGSYTAEEIIKGLLDRNIKSSTAAIKFNVYRKSAYGDNSIEGMMAIHDKMFILKSIKQSNREQAKIVYDYGCDGGSFRRLKGNLNGMKVKYENEINEHNTSYGLNITSLIANPVNLILKEKYKDKTPKTPFDKDDIISIHEHTDTGTISVEINATKRSDYERIVYELSPIDDWAITSMECYSGKKLIASYKGSNYFRSSGAGVAIAGHWEYKHYFADNDNPRMITEAKAVIEPILDFDFDDPKSFCVQFPPDALSPERARSLGAAYSIGQHSLQVVVDEQIGDLLKPTYDSASTPKVGTKPSNNVFDRDVSNTNKEKLALTNSDKPNIDKPTTPKTKPKFIGTKLAMIIIILALFISIVIAAYYILTTEEKKLIIGRHSIIFYTAVLVLLGILYIINITNVAEEISVNNQSLQVDANTDNIISSDNCKWPTEFVNKGYIGSVIKNNGQSFEYKGYLNRTNSIEINRWRMGAIECRTETTKETTRKYYGSSDKPEKTYWQPTIYTLLTCYKNQKKEHINIFTDYMQKISLDDLGILDSDLQSKAINPFLEIQPYNNNSVTFSLISNQKVQLIMKLSISNKGKTISEEYEYYDINGNIKLHYTMKYE